MSEEQIQRMEENKMKAQARLAERKAKIEEEERLAAEMLNNEISTADMEFYDDVVLTP